MRAPLVLALLLYGLIAAPANAAAALSADEHAALDALRQGEMARAVLRETPAPRIEETFFDAEGNPVTLADFAGKVVLLNFWATWCPPCRKEMPSIDHLAGEMSGDDLAIIALSTDRGEAARIQRFYDEIGVENLAIYRDPRGRTMRAAGVIGLPVTLLLDRQGREVARVTGDAVWDSAEAKALIGKLIELTGSEE